MPYRQFSEIVILKFKIKIIMKFKSILIIAAAFSFTACQDNPNRVGDDRPDIEYERTTSETDLSPGQHLDTAIENTKEAGRETKQDLKDFGNEVKETTQEAGRKTKEAAREAKRDVKESARETKEDIRNR